MKTEKKGFGGWLLNKVSMGISNMIVSNKKGFIQERIDIINTQRKKLDVNFTKTMQALAEAFSSDEIYKLNIIDWEKDKSSNAEIEAAIEDDIDNFDCMILMAPYLKEKHPNVWNKYIKYKNDHPERYQHYLKYKDISYIRAEMPNSGNDLQDVKKFFADCDREEKEFEMNKQKDLDLAIEHEKERLNNDLKNN